MRTLTDREIEEALSRAVCDSIERTTPHFRWWKSGLLIIATLAWALVILFVFGLILGARA